MKTRRLRKRSQSWKVLSWGGIATTWGVLGIVAVNNDHQVAHSAAHVDIDRARHREDTNLAASTDQEHPSVLNTSASLPRPEVNFTPQFRSQTSLPPSRPPASDDTPSLSEIQASAVQPPGEELPPLPRKLPSSHLQAIAPRATAPVANSQAVASQPAPTVTSPADIRVGSPPSPITLPDRPTPAPVTVENTPASPGSTPLGEPVVVPEGQLSDNQNAAPENAESSSPMLESSLPSQMSDAEPAAQMTASGAPSSAQVDQPVVAPAVEAQAIAFNRSSYCLQKGNASKLEDSGELALSPPKWPAQAERAEHRPSIGADTRHPMLTFATDPVDGSLQIESICSRSDSLSARKTEADWSSTKDYARVMSIITKMAGEPHSPQNG